MFLLLLGSGGKSKSKDGSSEVTSTGSEKVNVSDCRGRKAKKAEAQEVCWTMSSGEELTRTQPVTSCFSGPPLV